MLESVAPLVIQGLPANVAEAMSVPRRIRDLIGLDNVPTVSLGHDYVTQRGGAERVVLLLCEAFPEAVLHTLLYEPQSTYPEFGNFEVRSSVLNKVRLFRRHHRTAFPLLAIASTATVMQGDVAIISSSGWAHGMRTKGLKIVYCHAPARWLYQSERYLGRDQFGSTPTVLSRAKSLVKSCSLVALRSPLRLWDRRVARGADLYLANSSVTRAAIREAYGIDAEILPPPPGIDAEGPRDSIAELDGADFYLCVARLLPYKNVDIVISALGQRAGGRQVVIVGSGPDLSRLQGLAEVFGNVSFLQGVSDAQLRWLYANALALVATSYEDFGLTPLEAGLFGKPTLALKAGGYLDTVVDGKTGAFFDRATVESLAQAIDAFEQTAWDPAVIKAHVQRFSAEEFKNRLRQIILEATSGN